MEGGLEERKVELTDYHDGKVEALLDGLAVDLIWQVSKANVPLQLFTESAAQQGLFKRMDSVQKMGSAVRKSRFKSRCRPFGNKGKREREALVALCERAGQGNEHGSLFPPEERVLKRWIPFFFFPAVD